MMILMMMINYNKSGVSVFMVRDGTKTCPSASYLMLRFSTLTRVSSRRQKLGEFVTEYL